MTWGYSRLLPKKPYGTHITVIESVSKLVATGAGI